ncbi:ATP-binding protein [Streptomyces sp. NPDC050433]|uniref:ATP-binding protein n=1 Tax=Streptomyces sp. NPDC050433 TaxID=3365615 RepID=UPI0037A52FF4
MSRQCAGDRLVLPAVPEATGRARAFTAETLRSWEAMCILDDTLLVSSELVTNAVRATRGTDLVAVQLRVAGRSFYIEVWDSAPGVPVVNQVDADAEEGRGLRLVDALATRWGTCWPQAGGKVVWAELPLPGVPETPPAAASGSPSLEPLLR